MSKALTEAKRQALASVVGAAQREQARRKSAEAEFQVVAVAFIRLAMPTAVVAHIPNGGRRSKAEAARFKAMGVLAGMPDLLVLYSGTCSFIELKAGEGFTQPEQRAVHQTITVNGFPVGVCRTLDEVEAFLCRHYGRAAVRAHA